MSVNLSFLSMGKVPNLLTIFRMIASPVVALFIYLDSYVSCIIACLLFVFAGLSDFLDGYLARKFDAHSKFGECFDPIADKLMVILSVIALGFREKIYGIDLIPVMTIIIREVVISGVRGSLSFDEDSLKVSILGKIKTLVQIFSIAIIIFSSYLFAPLFFIGRLGLWISAFMSLLSLFIYLKNSFYLFKR